ncbi:MAG: abortive infection family protein [Magnetococcales bacterium]|nr:abortive infection family protein [Magnetococcales bacterium]
MQKAVQELIDCLKQDGFDYRDGVLLPITPSVRRILEVPPTGQLISENTRRNIIDALTLEKVNWAGRLPETDFLSRLWDLENMPSYDGRPQFKTAAADIWQHRENNQDWDDDWVFFDSRFNILKGPDETLLRFLCEMLHPVVRQDPKEVDHLVGLINGYLRADGWEIHPATWMSDRPVFSARHRAIPDNPALNGIRNMARAMDSSYLTQQITRMETSVERDPELAIGTAKELVETVCKTILEERGEDPAKDDLQKLVRRTAKALALLPDDINEASKGAETIRKILSSFGQITQGMAELRNLYGTGHGPSAKTNRGIRPRHARLATGAAATLASFLFETHLERKTAPTSNSAEVA